MLTGIVPALLTPFTAQGQLDTTALGELIEFILQHDVSGLYLCGSTGEGLLLTEEERRLVTETAIRQVGGRVPIVVHVGATSTSQAERLALHARQTGAAAVAAVPPFYYAVGRKGIEEHYRRLARAAELPVYLYSIPAATGVSIGADVVRSLFEEGVIKGLKYTSHDQLTFREIIELCGPGLNVLSGPDEMLLPFLVMGAHGGIGTTYNCLPHLYVALYQAWSEGEIQKARELQFQASRVILVLRDFGVVPAVKAAMGFLGVDCGAPRAPLMPLTEEQQGQLEQDLRSVGFFSQAVETAR